MKLIRKHWNRRDFLRAAGIVGGATALSAWMPRLSVEADVHGPAKRLLLVTHGNGSVLEEWRKNPGSPFVDGAALPTLTGPILAPLDRHRENLLLLDGIDLAAVFTPRGDRFGATGNKGHSGSSVLFTGKNGGGRVVGADEGTFPDMPSVDQVVNERIGGGRRTLQLAVWNRPLDPRSVYNYTSDAAPLPLQPNPQVAFDEVFRDGFAGIDEGARRRRRRQSTFSLLRGQLGRLRGQLPRGDRGRFDRHVEGLTSLEERLSVGAVCSTSAADRSAIGRDYRDDTPSTIDAQIDVVLNAFACDQVRVATLQLVPENSWGSAAFLGVDWRSLGGGGVHTVSHLQNADPDSDRRSRAVQQMALLNRFVATKFGELLDRMKAMGLLDDTLVVWAPGMSHAGYHSNANVPVVIAQGTAGPFRANRYLRWGAFEQPADGARTYGLDERNASNNDLLVSICHAMGLDDITSFGDPRYSVSDGLDGRLL